MKSATVAASAPILVLESACSLIVEGTSQTITLNTNSLALSFRCHRFRMQMLRAPSWP